MWPPKKIEPDFHLRVVNNIHKAKYKFIKGIYVLNLDLVKWMMCNTAC